jgi:RHS repeat-associated protein
MEHNIMGIDPSDSQNHAIFNATTQKRNTVDPRTGLFEVYVPLPSVTGNTGAGPVVDMSLFYTPVVNNAAALGDGWSFAFTHYYEKNQQLTLHSGEVLRVEKDKDLEQPAVIVTWDQGILTVLRRDGRAEVLKQLGDTQIYMPETLTTDGYNFLTLSWIATAHVIGESTHHQIKLTQIKDALRVLLKAEYTPASVEINFWPDDASEKLSFNLALEDYALKSVTAANGTTCTFGYQDHATCGWLLNEFNSFEGLKETVAYEDVGLAFDDNPKLSTLPSVRSHTLTPRGSTTEVKTYYSYDRLDSKSYATTVWLGASGVSPTPEQVADNSIRETVYKYDDRHELFQETTTQERASVTTKYTTSLFNESVRSTIVTYQKDNKTRKKTVSSKFGGNAEILSNSQCGECSEWYHSDSIYQALSRARTVYGILLGENAGELGSSNGDYNDYNLVLGFQEGAVGKKKLDRAPGDFFSKYLEAEVIQKGISAETSFSLPEKEYQWFGRQYKTIKDCTAFKYYNYKHIWGLSEKKITYVLQMINAAQDMTKAAFVGQQIEYFEDDDFRKGRQRKVTLDSAESKGELLGIGEPARTFDYTLEGTELTTTTTKTDAQGHTRTSSETHSILSGRLIRQVDEDGNRADYSYDTYGRLSTHTTCAQSPTYQQTTTYAYPSPGRLEVTEPNGLKRASEHDGQGNLVKEYLQTPEWAEWRLVLEVSYDKLGRELRTTRHDYLADGTQVSEWHELKYDTWNEECGHLYSDGLETFNIYDPVAMTRTEWTGGATDKHAKVTSYNDDETVAKVEWKNAAGTVYQTQTATYTPAGQVSQLQTTTEFGIITITYTYDGFGRLLSEQHSEKGKAQGATALTYTYRYQYPLHWLISEAKQIDIEFDGVTRTLGKRVFDSWGRVSSFSRGSSTETFTYDGASNVPSSKKTAEDTTLNFEYIKELGNRLSKVSAAAGTEKSFTYAYGAQLTSTAGEGERLLKYDHDLNTRLSKQRAQTQATKEAQASLAKEAQCTYSFGGRLLSEVDVQGNEIKYDYNNLGQRQKTESSDLNTTHAYNSFGRLKEEIITQGQTSLTVSYDYDPQQREICRSFKLGDKVDLTLHRFYNFNNSLNTILLKKGSEVLGSRVLDYTEGGRLASCTTTGVWRPKNPQNKDIDSQTFTYDALGNITKCVTQFGTGSCESTYTYDDKNGCRLERVAHSHSDYPHPWTLVYDGAGRVTKDQKGTTYSYDWLGRMTQAGSRHFTYDPMDRLMICSKGEEQRQIIYSGLQVRGEYHLSEAGTGRHLSPGSAACTVQLVRRSGVDRTLLELRDAEGSVLVSCDVQAETIKHHAYTAYGEHSSDEKDSLLGFNGEYRDADNDQYPLGQGYRWYDPDSRRFNSQDSLSPFGLGGHHAYGYCNGDPANVQDPSGHVGSGAVSEGLRRHWGDRTPAPLSLGKHGALISTIIWSGIGVMTALMTGGASLLLTAALVGLAIAAAATAITAVVIADTNPQLASILGWVSLGLTVFGGVATLLKKVGQFALYLARSGMAVARNLIHKATSSVLFAKYFF